jgi:hypothetical protein
VLLLLLLLLADPMPAHKRTHPLLVRWLLLGVQVA